MATLYIYNVETNETVAAITGSDQQRIEKAAEWHWGDTDRFASTYTEHGLLDIDAAPRYDIDNGEIGNTGYLDNEGVYVPESV